MMRYLVGLLMVFGLLAGSACADGLSEAARKRIAENKTEFLEAAATAINWFGDARGINAAAVDDFIEGQRAARRADVLGQMLVADQSADGAISAAELGSIAPSLSPNARGRLIARQSLADGNADGTADAEEIGAFARAVALRLVPDKDAEDYGLILLFDQDGGGWVSYAEVKTALAGIAA